MTDTNEPDGSSTDNQPVTEEYIRFDYVAEKTWQVILNGGVANIVIDLLTGADPGQPDYRDPLLTPSPEIRIYSEQPKDTIPTADIRDVVEYPDVLNPADGEPDAVWKSGEERRVAIIRVPHEDEQIPLIEARFDDTISKESARVTVYDLPESLHSSGQPDRLNSRNSIDTPEKLQRVVNTVK